MLMSIGGGVGVDWQSAGCPEGAGEPPRCWPLAELHPFPLESWRQVQKPRRPEQEPRPSQAAVPAPCGGPLVSTAPQSLCGPGPAAQAPGGCPRLAPTSEAFLLFPPIPHPI